jgi:two-component system, chemotaxis family, response regulator Rcp1
MESVSLLSIGRQSLTSLSVCTPAMSIRVPGSGWPYANESLSNIMAGFGSNPKLEKARPSSLPSQTKSLALEETLRVLVVEDNPSDVYLIRSAIEASGFKTSITIQKDGELATNFLDEIDRNAALSIPDLVILDLNLPKLKGTEVLENIRRSPRCQRVVVIVISTSALESGQEWVSRLGVSAYFRKPSEFDE